MDWTLEYDGEEKTFAAWGLEGPAFAFQSFAVSSATFQGRDAAFDEAALFAVDQPAIIRAGGTIIFQGLFAPEVRTGAGPTSSITYRVLDAWHELERRFFTGEGFYFPATNGTLGDAMGGVITAAATKGVSIQMGSAANLGASCLKLEFRDQTFASMLHQLRRMIPDTMTAFDYSTTPPTLYFIRRADATALTLPTAGADAWDGLDSMRALPELLTSGIVLRYVRQGTSGVDTFQDAYPVGSTPGDRGVVLATFDLRPATVQTQELITTNINPTSKAWWAERFPWVNGATGSGFTIDTTSRKVMSGGAWVDDTGGLTNEVLPGGAVPTWAGTAVTVLVTAVARNFSLNGQTYSATPLQCTVQATSLAGGTYTNETAPAEAPPSGLAQAYYGATSVLHYEGTITRRFDELSLPLPHTANVFNFSGGSVASRGWNTMRAVPQSIRVNVQTGEVQIALGPPAHLSIQDLLQLARMGGQGREVQPTPTSGGGISGTAASNSMPSAPSTAATPWTVLTSGVVVPGTVNGASPYVGTSARLSNTPPPELNVSGNKKVWFKLIWTITKNNGKIASATWLKSEIGVTSASADDPVNVVGDTQVTAYVLLAVVSSGVPAASYYSKAALTASFCDTATDAITVTLG